MLDIKKIRENLKNIEQLLAKKDKDINLNKIVEIDKNLKTLVSKLNNLQAEQNNKSKEIGIMKSKGEESEDLFSDLKKLSEEVKLLEKDEKKISLSLKDELLQIPNLPHSSVPIGISDQDNVVKVKCDKKKDFNFLPKNHIDLGKNLDILDFETAAKISGSGFPMYKGKGALLERALINFMIDFSLKNYGYTEFFTPFMVKPDSALTTGQLPKFDEDMYYIEKDDLFLIPTAEVSLTNIHKDEILRFEDLPKYYLGYSSCFRREAGSYGKDTRGLLRVHQFNKVELVKFVEPSRSYEELEMLVNQAAEICKLLELDYRIIELCTGDLSFSAAKCYDIEVWAPGESKWLEGSSCSNLGGTPPPARSLGRR